MSLEGCGGRLRSQASAADTSLNTVTENSGDEATEKLLDNVTNQSRDAVTEHALASQFVKGGLSQA
jgi:hypothetical protein